MELISIRKNPVIRFRHSAGVLALGCAGMVGAQIPNAPALPVCAMSGSPAQSNCSFKTVVSGTPTSIVGNRVVLFDQTVSGGHGTSRQFLRDALTRLDTRYNFDLVFTTAPSYFTAANLATAKVVLFSNGDGDVLPAGVNRTALENFQQQNGWGVIWIHAACAFITTGWPFGQNSCVQQYYTHNGSGTSRQMYLDSGTAASPNHGTKNPQTEFLLRRPMPGTWGNNQELTMTDEWYSFRGPARSTAGVNVHFSYDETSGAPSTVMGAGNHNMVWHRMMGNGITVYNSWGHDVSVYSGYGNFGDSLLWRYLRYAAKDWCSPTTGGVGCPPTPISMFTAEARRAGVSLAPGLISVMLNEGGRNAVSVSDVAGKEVYHAAVIGGTGKAVEISGLRRGVYFVKVASANGSGTQKVLLQ